MTSNYDRWKTTDKYDAPDPLEGKPLGRCPWCNSEVGDTPSSGGSHHDYELLHDPHWDESLTETENRIRYAAQVLEESAMWKKIGKQGGDV